MDELAAPPTVLELDDAVDLGEERVVLAQTDVLAGVELRAALADDDRAPRDRLAAERLHAQVLGVGVAAVTAGALSFFMCHELEPPAGNLPLAGGRQLDLVDTDPVQMLPVAGGPAERRTLLLLE